MGLFSSFHDAITRKAYLIHRPHLWPNDRHDFAIFLSVEINKVMDNHDKQHQTPIRLAVSLYQQTLSFNPDDDEIEALAKSVVAGAILSGLVLENLKTIKANPHIEGIYFRKASDIFDRLIAHCGKVYGLNPRSGAEKLVAIALEHTQIKDFMKSWPIYARPFLYATDNRVASRPKPEKVEPEVKTLYSDGKNSLTVSSAENPQLPGLPYSVSSTANGIDITFHTNPDLFPPPTPPEPAVSKGRDSIACDVTPDAEPPPSEGSNSDNSRNVIDFLNPLTWPKNSEELMTAIVEAIAKLEAFDKGNASPGREAGFRLFLDSKFNNVIIPMRFQRIKWLALSHAESDPARKVPGNPYLYGYNRLFEFIRACTPILHTEHLQALRENIGYPWGINTYGWEVGKENEAETPTAAPNKGVGCLALFFLLVLFSIASKALGLPGLFRESSFLHTPPDITAGGVLSGCIGESIGSLLEICRRFGDRYFQNRAGVVIAS